MFILWGERNIGVAPREKNIRAPSSESAGGIIYGSHARPSFFHSPAEKETEGLEFPILSPFFLRAMIGGRCCCCRSSARIFESGYLFECVRARGVYTRAHEECLTMTLSFAGAIYGGRERGLFSLLFSAELEFLMRRIVGTISHCRTEKRTRKCCAYTSASDVPLECFDVFTTDDDLTHDKYLVESIWHGCTCGFFFFLRWSLIASLVKSIKTLRIFRGPFSIPTLNELTGPWRLIYERKTRSRELLRFMVYKL